MPQSPLNSHVYEQAVLQSCPLRRWHDLAAWTRSCCLVSHRARKAQGEKRSQHCAGEQVHAASVQIQQPNTEAAAAALCSAGALGSAGAWPDRKQKKRVNNGGVFKLLFELYLALTPHRAIA